MFVHIPRTLIMLQYCWCHSGCSCLNGSDIVILYIIYIFCFSFGSSLCLDLQHNFEVHVDLTSWPTPSSSKQPILILHCFCYTPRFAHSPGRQTWMVVTGSIFLKCILCSCGFRSYNSHFKTRALVQISCTICKKCKSQKKTFKAHCLVLLPLTFALIVFNDLLFLSCCHFNIYYQFFLYIIDRLCVSMYVCMCLSFLKSRMWVTVFS